MVERAEGFRNTTVLDGAKLVLGNAGFAAFAWIMETAIIVCTSMLTAAFYHEWVYDSESDVRLSFGFGCGAALLYALPFLFRGEYRMLDFLDGHRSVGRQALAWTYAFICLGVIGFLTKTTDTFSRGWLVLFFIVGFAALIASSEAIRRGLLALLKADRLARRRLLLVGGAEEIARLNEEMSGVGLAARVAGSVALPTAEASGSTGKDLIAALAQAVTKARSLRIDDVVILTDWSRTKLIHEIVEAFRALPVGIHLGASSVVGPFTDARITHFATMTAVSLTAPPLNPTQSVMKRAFDVVVSALGLVVLSPVLLVIAGLIKATSDGPVFFRQRRRGYNQVEFKIWKFRTMTSLDDGPEIQQARANDQRVTWIGAYLRKYSLDELPQLLNVLQGEMSLVGPRPHAVAHDEIFEKRIATYARRLNVRPGITGWAQVQGLRGITDTDEKMRRRVECDLYYIDNWSIAFDLYIIALTILSPRVYMNAH